MSRLAQPLAMHLAGYAARAFDWPGCNCCHLVAAWVLAREGSDPMAGLPSTSSKLAARRLIRALGGSLADAWTRQLGRAPIAPTLAQVGDVVRVVLPNDGEAVGICGGRDVWVLGDQGVGRVPLSCATHAWRLQCADR